MLLLLLLSATCIYSTQEPLKIFKLLEENSEIFHQGPGKMVADLRNKISLIAKDNEEKQKKIAWQAQNVMPIIHPELVPLIEEFIKIQHNHGSEIEKKVYKDMNKQKLIERLLTHRPLMFMGATDWYLLKNGEHLDYDNYSSSPYKNNSFDNIGTPYQKEPFILENYISYDEMAIASLIGVSVPTFFINNGARGNAAVPSEIDNYQETGIYTGLVGTRFERENLMEFKHMLITREQNTVENGYGENTDLNNKAGLLLNLWAQFYEKPYFPLYKEVEQDTTGQFIQINNKLVSDYPVYLDSVAYKKRMLLTIETFLNDANNRAKSQKQKAYCHVVGLGLGVWAINAKWQAELMLDVFHSVLSTNNFEWISDVNFSYFPENCESYWRKDNWIVRLLSKIIKIILTPSKINNVNIIFSKRNPADKLQGSDADKLLVAMYAWDGNAYPGNEYWRGHINASGDPVAACCSTIPELQNPDINPFMLTNINHAIKSAKRSFVNSFNKICNYKIPQSTLWAGLYPVPSLMNFFSMLLFFIIASRINQ